MPRRQRRRRQVVRVPQARHEHRENEEHQPATRRETQREGVGRTMLLDQLMTHERHLERRVATASHPEDTVGALRKEEAALVRLAAK